MNLKNSLFRQELLNLVLDGVGYINNGKLVVSKTPNAENTLIQNMKPILGCDVWEHSYYVDYKNRRPEYLENFYEKLINWEFVESQLD